MRAFFCVAALCLHAGLAQAQEEKIVFPVPEATAEVSAGFYDSAYLAKYKVQHIGHDIPGPDGSKVLSPVDGIVILNKTDADDPMAAYLVIRSKVTGFEHVLGHIRSNLDVSTEVKPGTLVGYIVTAGSGPHLHYGINRLSVAGAINVPAGWGFGRGPATSTIQTAAALGWIDPGLSVRAATRADAPAEKQEWGPGLVSGVDAGYDLAVRGRRPMPACLNWGSVSRRLRFRLQWTGTTLGQPRVCHLSNWARSIWPWPSISARMSIPCPC